MTSGILGPFPGYVRDRAARAADKRARVAWRLGEIGKRTQYIAVPCHWCKDDCMEDDGPEYIDTKMAVCYSCAELACRS